MNKRFFLLILLLSTGLLGSCATVSMMPTSASEVDFASKEGKTGWSQYHHIETFHGYKPEQIYEAAKVGLGEAGFSLRVADKSKGMVLGEHGITLHDWNVIAGVYFQARKEDSIVVKVIVEGSKDIGFSGDVTSDGWTGKILHGLRSYLNETYQAVLKVDKADLK
jgi:hypothetical protein